jgi:hypothetical protein
LVIGRELRQKQTGNQKVPGSTAKPSLGNLGKQGHRLRTPTNEHSTQLIVGRRTQLEQLLIGLYGPSLVDIKFVFKACKILGEPHDSE